MKVLGLISGGKDSCYSLMLCERHGHEVVALGNLAPDPELAKDDLDSWMYQTVGHNVVESYAQCTGLPLYRVFTRGTSISRELSYYPSSGDEVEDLYRLVCHVKEQIPDLGGVCSGAIASDYQRLRVESVCTRLGLISLSFLWKQPQLPLLEDMISCGILAVLVKVAAMGLVPEKHLGQSLAEMKGHLESLHGRYGCNVCGEGGEYETLVLDCPFFTYGRIRLDASTVSKDSSAGDIAPVGILGIESFHVEPKREVDESLNTGQVVVVPSVLDACLLTTVDQQHQDHRGDSLECEPVSLSVTETSGFIRISLRCSDAEDIQHSSKATQRALHAMMIRLETELSLRSMDFSDIVFVHLFLRDMEHFASANRIYTCFFPSVNPPSRACVQLSLSSPCALDILAVNSSAREHLLRSVIHVQSFSSWAPCCIGPYSQATSVGGFTFMAGQLGLDPASMSFRDMSWSEEVSLAMKHCQSVAIALGNDFWRSTLKVDVYLSEAFAQTLSDTEKDSLKSMIERYWSLPNDSESEAADPSAAEKVLVNDTYLSAPELDYRLIPIVSYITVPALPKRARIEIQPILLNRNASCHDDTNEETDEVSTSSVTSAGWISRMTHRWTSVEFAGPVERHEAYLDSDEFDDPPSAVMLRQNDGFRVGQIRVPGRKQRASVESSERLVIACCALLDHCLAKSETMSHGLISMTVWFSKGAMNEQGAQYIVSAIQSELEKSHAGHIEWRCLPSNNVGSEVAKPNAFLVDVLCYSSTC